MTSTLEAKVDFHYYDVRLKRSLKRVWESLPSKDAELIQGFIDFCLAEGLSPERCNKYAQILRRIRLLLGQPFPEADKRAVEGVMARINHSGYQPATFKFYKVALKKFYRWLRDVEEDPSEVAWIKLTLKESEKILPEDILTAGEVKALAVAAHSLRDKAFIEAAYEGGFRPSEMLTLRIRNVEFDQYGAVVTVRGKTGSRRVRMVESASRLQMWIENHPMREDPDAWLWINVGNTNRGAQYKYNACRKMLRVVATRAKISKRLNPYSLRHARATHCAQWMTEAQMCEFFGWVQGSRQPRIYVHLCGRDVDPTILAHYGILEKKELESPLKPRKCPRCEALNSHDAKYCRRCSMILDPEEALRVEHQRHNLEKKVEELLKRLEALEGKNAALEDSNV